MPLPLRLRPEADESLVGFLLRLAARNGRDDIATFARMLGVPFTVLEAAATTRFDLGEFASMSCVPEARLAAMASWSQGRRHVCFRGTPLPRSMFSLARRKACPLCLGSSRHHRAIWDVSIVTVCPDHAVRLVSQCSSCLEPLRWTGPEISKCRCGFDFARAPAIDVPHAVIGGVRETSRLLGLASASWSSTHQAVAPVIACLEVSEVLGLMLHLGWYGAGQRGLPRPTRDGRGLDDFHAILDGGYRTACDWPASFHVMLAHVRDDASRRRGRYGVRKELGGLMTWLAGLEGGSAVHQLVQPEVAGHIAREGIRARSPLCRTTTPPVNLTLNETARRLGRSSTKVRQALVGDQTAQQRGRGSPIALPRTEIEAVADELAGLRDKRALARGLGCGRKLLEAVLSAGYLAAWSGRSAQLAGTRRWRAADAIALVERLERAVTGSGVDGIHLVTAYKHLRQGGMSSVAATGMLIGGGLRPVGRDTRATGLQRLLFDREEVASVVAGGRVVELTLSVPQVAKALGIKQELAYRLCATGVIGTSSAEVTRRGCRIEPAELDRFQREYVLPGKVVTGQRQHRGWLAAQLLAAGAQAVSGPGVDGGRQYVFRRDDLRRARVDIPVDE